MEHLRRTFVAVLCSDCHDYGSDVRVLWDACGVNALTEERCVIIHISHSHLYLRRPCDYT